MRHGQRISKYAKRESAVELLRMASMFLIVLHHYVVHGELYSNPDALALGERMTLSLLASGGRFGADLFVLISGYFTSRSRFSWKRIVLLLVEVEITCNAAELLYAWYTGDWPYHGHVTWWALFPVVTGEYWFATAFAVMIVMSPLLNAAIEHCTRNQLLGVLIVLFLIWSVVPGIWTDTTVNRGHELWFIVLYLMAGFVRKYVHVDPRRTKRWESWRSSPSSWCWPAGPVSSGSGCTRPCSRAPTSTIPTSTRPSPSSQRSSC